MVLVMETSNDNQRDTMQTALKAIETAISHYSATAEKAATQGDSAAEMVALKKVTKLTNALLALY
tara:strand:+ start:20 stop:214 length:195 start_codon:yes stop_codon:yes gene_type:complete